MALVARYELADIKAQLSMIRIIATRGGLTGEMVAAYGRLEKRKEKLEAIVAEADEVAE